MQSSKQQYFSRNPSGPGPPVTGQGGHNGCTHNNDTPFSSLFNDMPPNVKHLSPFQNVNFQLSETCPKNFVIFDRTDNRNQIMYHPDIAQKSCFPDGQNIGSPWLLQNNMETKEDSDDIDALLSFEEGEYDDEEVSTGRSFNYGSDSSAEDSCSSSKPRKKTKLFSSSGSGKRKREKIKKMVTELRGMVPGSSKNRRMNSVDVLDEAVKYLKSLKVDVQKVGVGNSKTKEELSRGNLNKQASKQA